MTSLSTPRPPEALLEARVSALSLTAEGIVGIELVPAGAQEFPPFEAGAHIDLHLPNGLVRSYSLTNEGERARYVVHAGRESAGLGGSRYLHEELRPGTALVIGAPRNNFPLDEAADHSVLISGGIGVTPIWCMV